MTTPYILCAVVLLVSIIVGLWRAARGPTRADRMQTAQLFGTGGTALLMLCWRATGEKALLDIALLLALLAAVTVITFTRRAWPRPARKDEGAP